MAMENDSSPQYEYFPLFQLLPTELRIKIWKFSFVPRRITFKDTSIRPTHDLRSSAALLLTNKEANLLFRECYDLAFDTRHRRPIFINYSLDTIQLNGGMLSKFLVDYPSAMGQVQLLDLSADTRPPSSGWARTFMELMVDLRLVSVSCFNCGQRQGSRVEAAEFGQSWLVAELLTVLRAVLSKQYYPDRLIKPNLAVVFDTEEVPISLFKDLLQTLHMIKPTARDIDPFIFTDPSPATWKTLVLDIPNAQIQPSPNDRTARWFASVIT
jgi:hypothetical protein